MGIPNLMQTGRSGMMTAQANIATTGHNVANANTPGYSRQRAIQETNSPHSIGTGVRSGDIGTGSKISRIERINDEYLEKHLRNGSKDLAHFEEKDVMLHQLEDVFNEMNGEGMNRLMTDFFNQFRKLSTDPDSEAVRQAIRESSSAVVSDFKRLHSELKELQNHIDSRIEGYCNEATALANSIKDVNLKIKAHLVKGGAPGDLLDQRDQLVKQLGSLLDISVHKDNSDGFIIDVDGIGPLVSGGASEKFTVQRTQADGNGKPEGAVDIYSTGSAGALVTHRLKGGKLGALLEVRDKTLSNALERLDDLAYNVSTAVNEVHRQGFTRSGGTGVAFFKPLAGKFQAAKQLDLSDAIKSNISNIAAAALPDSPGDNRVAIALASIQNARIMNNGKATADDWYNSIISDVGVISGHNRFALNQQKDINSQLDRMREQISGVSLDEETANLLQFQHAFGASAKVIQVADEMLDTVLNLKR